MQYQHNGAEVRCRVCKSVFVGVSIEAVMEDLQLHMHESHGYAMRENRPGPAMHELNCNLCTKAFIASKYAAAARDLDRHMEEDHPRVMEPELRLTESDKKFLQGMRISPL
jgi:hypothetical protein